MNYTAKVDAKYAPLKIADFTKADEFKVELIAHQQGKTDFLIFIKMCAETGIEKWKVYIENMTCTYFDRTNASDILKQANK